MEDITQEITILADKIGIGIDTLYQLNLSIQTIKALSDSITLISAITAIIIVGICIYKWDNSGEKVGDTAGKIITFCMIAAIIFLGCFISQYVIEDTILRIYAPQYMAMKDTLSMIGVMK